MEHSPVFPFPFPDGQGTFSLVPGKGYEGICSILLIIVVALIFIQLKGTVSAGIDP